MKPFAKTCLILTNLICLLLISVIPQAEVYKWYDEQGRVHYGDHPKGKNATQVDINTSPQTNETRAENWDEIQQRQQKFLDYLEDERGDRDEEKAKKADQLAERKKQCDEARKYNQKLISNRVFYRKDKDDNKVYLSDEEKDAEIRTTEEMMDKFCTK